MRRSRERRAVQQVNKPCLLARMERKEGERSTHVKGSRVGMGVQGMGLHDRARGWKLETAGFLRCSFLYKPTA